MHLKRWILVGLLGIAFALPGGAQLSSECEQARVYHLQVAMDWRFRDDQSFHLGAAEAAGQLTDPNCNGWEDYANSPAVSQPAGSQSAFNSLEAS